MGEIQKAEWAGHGLGLLLCSKRPRIIESTQRGGPQILFRMGPKRNDKVKDTLLEIPQDPGFIKLQENSISYLMMYTKNEL